MKSIKLAESLLNHTGLASKILPQNRLPNFQEFRLLVNAVESRRRTTMPSEIPPQRESYNERVFQILREMKSYQIYRDSINRAQSRLGITPQERTIKDEKTHKRELVMKQYLLHDNLQILRRLNAIQRMHGQVDSFNRTHDAHKPELFLKRSIAKKIKYENRRFGCRLEQMKSKVDCHNERFAQSPNDQKPKISQEIIRKYQKYMPAPTGLGKRSRTFNEMLRPMIYFDLCVGTDRQHLGRITIQLYTEVSPEVVLEFVRLATENDVQAHRFTHIFSELWMEGMVTPQSQDALHNHHNRQSHIDAREVRGVLSYAWDYRKQFPQGLLHYSISFKKLACHPLQRIIFGRVMSGCRLLDVCREYGTKSGKCKKYIMVVKSELL